MTTKQHYPTYYETSIHAKAVGFIAQQAASITQLSEGSINDIRSLFPDPIDFTRFCAAWVKDLDLSDVYDLRDQIYPEEGEPMELHTYTAYEPDHPDADCHGVVTYELD